MARILVVEDRAVIRLMLMEMLALDQHVVEAAAGGREGWAKFRAGQFDVVITDRQMPGLTGDELALAIKRVAPRTPVLMLTGYGADMQGTGERPPGVDLVVGKPVALAGLRAALAQLTGPRR